MAYVISRLGIDMADDRSGWDGRNQPNDARVDSESDGAPFSGRLAALRGGMEGAGEGADATLRVNIRI